MKSFASVALDLKVAVSTLMGGLSLGAVDWMVNFESALPSIASVVAIIGAVIIAVSHYCKMVWDNRNARADARLKELVIAGEQKDNQLKDLLIQEQRLKNKALKKQADEDEFR
jgi:hypothetical protein